MNLRVLAASLSVVVLAGCVERLHANVGHWGVFVFWAVAGIVALVWPVAFLVTGFGATQRQRWAVYVTAFALTVSSIGLLQVGWGLVMVLHPEYAVGWYIPARGGGSEIDTTADATETGRFMIAVGTLFSVIVVAGVGGMASHSGETEKSGPAEEALSVRDQVGAGALVLWGCGALFWLVTLGLGLIAVIQYDGVREKLAECTPGSGMCATDAWMANELPWILVAASVFAMLPAVAAIVVRRSLSRIVSAWGDLPPTLMLVAGWLYQTGSVLALASGVLYARWSDATCTGRGSLRRCGATEAGFSFADAWLPWVIVWTLISYAVLAYLVVFLLLANAELERAARPTDTRTSSRVKGGRGEAGASGSAGRHVLIYLVSLAILIGVAWSAIGLWQRGSTPAETSGSPEEYAAENMSSSAYPHLEKAEFEIPHRRDDGLPVVAHIVLGGDEPEMPSAEVVPLIEAACSYRPSRWRADTPQTWVKVAYGTGRDKTRFAQLRCETSHRQATAGLLAWMEDNPADGAADEVSIRSRDDDVLETELYLPDSSATSFRKALTYLCALPTTGDVQRSGTISDNAAINSISDIDCGDPDAAVAKWRDFV